MLLYEVLDNFTAGDDSVFFPNLIISLGTNSSITLKNLQGRRDGNHLIAKLSRNGEDKTDIRIDVEGWRVQGERSRVRLIPETLGRNWDRLLAGFDEEMVTKKDDQILHAMFSHFLNERFEDCAELFFPRINVVLGQSEIVLNELAVHSLINPVQLFAKEMDDLCLHLDVTRDFREVQLKDKAIYMVAHT